MLWGPFVEDITQELYSFYEDFIAGKRPKLAISCPPQVGKSWAAEDFIAWVGQRVLIRTRSMLRLWAFIILPEANRAGRLHQQPSRTKLSTSRQLLEHAVHMRIIDASCTENGSDGGDGSPEGTDKLSTSVTNRVRIAAGKAAKSAAQYWTHRDLRAS
jgi:hypothetical protein